jgi:hypothetical protein
MFGGEITNTAPTTFRHTKRLPIRISKPYHKKFHFKKNNKVPRNLPRSVSVLACSGATHFVFNGIRQTSDIR